MTASDPSFSLPTTTPGCPRTIQHPLPPLSQDAPCSLYKCLSSHSTQRASSTSLRAGTRTLSEPAGEAPAPGASLPRIRGLRAWDGLTVQTMNSNLISSFLSLSLQGKHRPRNAWGLFGMSLCVCLEAEGWVCLPRFRDVRQESQSREICAISVRTGGEETTAQFVKVKACAIIHFAWVKVTSVTEGTKEWQEGGNISASQVKRQIAPLPICMFLGRWFQKRLLYFHRLIPRFLF